MILSKPIVLIEADYEALREKLRQPRNKIVKFTLTDFAIMHKYVVVAAERERVTAKLTEKFEKKTQVLVRKLTRQAKQAAQQAAQQAIEQAAQQAFSSYLTVMRSWHKGFDIDAIVDIVDLSEREVKPLIAAFEVVKTAFRANQSIEMEALTPISNLSEAQLNALLALLKR
jgi:hypothetical protein